jgi:transposase-like protein
MDKKRTRQTFSPEVHERAVRMAREHRGEHGSLWNTIVSIAAKIGCSAQTLNEWVKRTRVDSGERPGTGFSNGFLYFNMVYLSHPVALC